MIHDHAMILYEKYGRQVPLQIHKFTVYKQCSPPTCFGSIVALLREVLFEGDITQNVKIM